MLEKTTVRWPAALRRRFLSALYYCTRKRWPYTPYRAAAQLGRPVKRAEIAKIYGLRSPAKTVETVRPRFKCYTGSLVRDLDVIRRATLSKSAI
jgi:hypothetical protein